MTHPVLGCISQMCKDRSQPQPQSTVEPGSTEEVHQCPIPIRLLYIFQSPQTGRRNHMNMNKYLPHGRTFGLQTETRFHLLEQDTADFLQIQNFSFSQLSESHSPPLNSAQSSVSSLSRSSGCQYFLRLKRPREL